MSAPKVLQLKNFFRSNDEDFVIGNINGQDIRSGECKAVIFPVNGYIDDTVFDSIKINMLAAPGDMGESDNVRLVVCEWTSPDTHTLLAASEPIMWDAAGEVTFNFNQLLKFNQGAQVRLFFTKSIPENLSNLWNNPREYCCLVNIKFDHDESYDSNCKYYYGGGWVNEKYLIIASFLRENRYIVDSGSDFINELITAMQANGQTKEEVIQNIIDLNNNTFVVADEETSQP